jgi:hypothetical protein
MPFRWDYVELWFGLMAVDGSGWTKRAVQYLRRILAKLFESLAASIGTGDL